MWLPSVQGSYIDTKYNRESATTEVGADRVEGDEET